jgi:hypothetical protein
MFRPFTVIASVMAATLLSVLFTPALAAEGLKLVDNGKTECVIVLSKDASPSETFAAEELAAHIKQMSGAAMKVGPEAGARQLHPQTIFIGFGEAAQAAGVKADATLGTDGYVIKVDPAAGRVVIAGGKKRGTLYGVYAFLEQLGCRWWTPTESTIPQRKTIEVPAMDLRQVPRFEYRDMLYKDIFPIPTADPNNPDRSPQLWAARNRINGMGWDDAPDPYGGRYRVSGNLVHSYMTLLKESGVEIKPEMTALRSGQRSTGQPCLSSPDVLAAIVKAVVAKLKADPSLEFVVVGQEDNGNYCTCPECAAIDKEEDSHAGQVIRFANRVAAAVEKQVPGAKIVTAAYEWSRKPPKNLKPRANVYITLCSIECDFAHPLAAANNPENKAFKEDIEGWAKIAPKIFIWHYCGNRDHYLMPNPDLETFAPNSKFFADNKVAGVFVQGTHVGSMTEFVPLRMWLWSKVLWDPNADGNALIREFCKGYYGPAAEGVLKYINVMHATGHDANMMFHLGRRGWLNEPFLRPEVMADAAAALTEADHAITGDDATATMDRRLWHAQMPVLYVLFKRGPASATWKAVQKKVGSMGTVKMAQTFANAVNLNKVNFLADPEDVKPYVDWMQDYAKLIASGPGKDLPSELASADPNTYRLIHAVQMDRGAKWWQKTEGASDGWAVRIPAAGWYVRHMFSPWDDFTPGKTYQLYIRVKADLASPGSAVASKVLKDGKAFEAILYGGTPKLSVTFDSAELKDGKWHVLKVGGPMAWTDANAGGFYLPLTRDGAVDAVYLDCLWLAEVPPAPAK